MGALGWAYRLRRVADVDLVELASSGESFEVDLAHSLKADVGAGDELDDGAGDEHLAGLGLGHHAGGDVYGDPADVAAAAFELAAVQADADLQPEVGDRPVQRGGAADRLARGVEGGQHPVAGVFDDPAAKEGHLAVDGRVVGVEQGRPSGVTLFFGQSSGVHDVAEQNGRDKPVIKRGSQPLGSRPSASEARLTPARLPWEWRAALASGRSCSGVDGSRVVVR